MAFALSYFPIFFPPFTLITRLLVKTMLDCINKYFAFLLRKNLLKTQNFMCEKCLKFVPVCSIKHEIRFPSGGFAPLNPLPGRCPGPAGGLERHPDPSPYLVPILHSSSSYATGNKCQTVSFANTICEYSFETCIKFNSFDAYRLYSCIVHCLVTIGHQ